MATTERINIRHAYQRARVGDQIRYWRAKGERYAATVTAKRDGWIEIQHPDGTRGTIAGCDIASITRKETD